MFNESEFNEVGFNEDRTTFIGRVLIVANDMRNFVSRTFLITKDIRNIIDRVSLVANGIRNFSNRAFLTTFDIMGLATARKIKAVVRDIRVRFRIK